MRLVSLPRVSSVQYQATAKALQGIRGARRARARACACVLVFAPVFMRVRALGDFGAKGQFLVLKSAFHAEKVRKRRSRTALRWRDLGAKGSDGGEESELKSISWQDLEEVG
eukprot:5907563-Pleurochrysis_carterae.AAC.1